VPALRAANCSASPPGALVATAEVPERGAKCGEGVRGEDGVIPPTSPFSCCLEGRRTPGQLVSPHRRQKPLSHGGNGARDLGHEAVSFVSHLFCNILSPLTVQTKTTPTTRKRGKGLILIRLLFLLFQHEFDRFFLVGACVCFEFAVCVALSYLKVCVCGLFDVSSNCFPSVLLPTS